MGRDRDTGGGIRRPAVRITDRRSGDRTAGADVDRMDAGGCDRPIEGRQRVGYTSGGGRRGVVSDHAVDAAYDPLVVDGTGPFVADRARSLGRDRAAGGGRLRGDERRPRPHDTSFVTST